MSWIIYVLLIVLSLIIGLGLGRIAIISLFLAKERDPKVFEKVKTSVENTWLYKFGMKNFKVKEDE